MLTTSSSLEMRYSRPILTAAALTALGAAATFLHFEDLPDPALRSENFPQAPASPTEPVSGQDPSPENSGTALSFDALRSDSQPMSAGAPTDRSAKAPSEPLQNPVSKLLALPEHPRGKQLAALIQAGVALELLVGPFRAWAIQEPEKSSRWVERNLEGALKARLLADAVAVWSEGSPNEALQWLASLEDDTGLEGAFEAALHASAKLDSYRAAVWLKANGSHGSLENWQNVLTVWGENAPVEAAQFFSTQINPSLKDALLPSALIGMKEGSAADLLLRGVDGPTADHALVSAAKALSFGAPQYAIQLAERIADANLRSAATLEILSRWRDTNPGEAFAYATSRRIEIPQPNLKAIPPPAPAGVEISPSR